MRKRSDLALAEDDALLLVVEDEIKPRAFTDFITAFQTLS